MESLGVKFFGTRGIISSPRPETKEFGGNTSCIQILGENEPIIVDTGFGVSVYGEELMPLILATKKTFRVHIFFTHFHWDHIQGLPFFHPVYFPHCELHVYAPYTKEYIWESLDILFDGTYSPFEGLDKMPAKVEIHPMVKPMTLHETKVSYFKLDHYVHNPDEEHSAFAFKFEKNNESLVIATDHDAKPGPVNDAFIGFATDAGILVHDAQYFDGEAEADSFGHATATRALANAEAAQAKLTLLTHHDPGRDDSSILLESRRLKELYPSLNFEFAREYQSYSR